MSTRRTFGTSLLLFAGLRLALLMTFPPDALFGYGDFRHYYNLALWSVPGQCPLGPNPCLPLLDYWYEFPPVFPYLSLLVFNLVGGGGVPPFHAYAYGLAAVMLAADLGTFALVRRVADCLHGPEAAGFITWAYALMPAPLILAWWTFDGLTTFWLLLGLYALLVRRDGLSALAMGLGAATKLVPLLLLPAAWQARAPRRAALITAGALGVLALALLPFFWRAPEVTVASLLAQPSKSSYATVWALLDGNVQDEAGQPVTGNFGPLMEHFDLARATAPVHRPSRVPGWLTLPLFGVMYGWVWWRRGDLTPRPPFLKGRGSPSIGGHPDNPRTSPPWYGVQAEQVVTLLAFTWAVFALWSKGWSPQWQQMLVPLILLLHPNRTGVLLALLLAAVSFLEWPVLLSRGLAWGYWLTVPLRTALLVGWAAALAQRLLRGSGEARV